MDGETLTMLPTRHLAWEPCWNVRDLGGLPTADGGQTRYGALFRADCLGKLTAAGRRALLDAGVTTVIDLRSPAELAADPPIFPGGRAGEPAFRNVPLDRHDPKAGPLYGAAQTRFDIYRIVLDHYPDALAEVLAAIDSAPPGGVVFHCLGGTDRTGLVAAAALRLAGVPDEAIADDYALTLERRRPIYAHLVAEKGEAGLGFWDRLNMTADQMLLTLAYVDERYGGMEAYLRAGGLSDEAMAGVRARLRE
jgi:protein tyrosine/serine phosphatase